MPSRASTNGAKRSADRARQSEDYDPKPAIKLHGQRIAVHLYLPWRSPGRWKREAGFMVRVRDPRAPCDHMGSKTWLQDSQSAAWCAQCDRCGEWLQVRRGRVVYPRANESARWLWIKVFAAKTRAGRRRTVPGRAPHRHGVLMLEAEAHWADERGSHRYGSDVRGALVPARAERRVLIARACSFGHPRIH